MHMLLAVHYTGRLAADGDIFMDSKSESNSKEPVQMVAGRGKSASVAVQPCGAHADLANMCICFHAASQPRESGLSLALATMRAGEKSAVYIEDARWK
eukprot:366436-Chlamydomonas_euryale.AAC.14